MKRRNFAKAKESLSRYVRIGEDPRKKAKAADIVKEIEARDLDDAVFREAYDFIRMGEEEKGIERAREFLSRHAGVWNGWFLLGWGLRRLDRWEEAIAAFRQAAELGGEGCDVRNELAICLMETGDLSGARKELEKALRLENDNVKVISNLGVVALRSGRKSEAAGFFRTVLELDPEDQVAKRYLADLWPGNPSTSPTRRLNGKTSRRGLPARTGPTVPIPPERARGASCPLSPGCGRRKRRRRWKAAPGCTSSKRKAAGRSRTRRACPPLPEPPCGA
jgi:Flp pilus assembly protein TadD